VGAGGQAAEEAERLGGSGARLGGVVEPQPLQRRLERAPGVALADVLDPELGGDEQLAARDAAGGDGTADG
jgi:hypothetical protein